MEREIINNAFYDELHEKWYTADNHPIALLRAENKARVPWVRQHIKHHFSEKPCSILDVGCGAGFLTNSLALDGHNVSGIDLSDESLKVAREKDSTRSVAYQSGDAYALPFSEGSFDVVCAMDLLEHVEDPQKVVTQAARILKPGGLFFFHTFNRNPISWLFVIKGVEWFVSNTPSRMHLYNLFIKPKELKIYCEKNRLNVHTMKGLNPKLTSRAFWKMLFSRKVPSDFTFALSSSLISGYVGYAIKT